MQECVLHIKLVDRAGMGDGQGKHRVNGCWLDHRAEGLIIVDVRALGEAAKDPTSLVPLQVPSELDLCLKIHLPMTTLEPTRDEISSVVSDQSIIFFFYGMTLGRVGEGGTDEGGHQREQQ
jgi:hypothetical protein